MGKLVRCSIFLFLIIASAHTSFSKSPDAHSPVIVLLPGHAAPSGTAIKAIEIPASKRTEHTLQELLTEARKRAVALGANVIAVERTENDAAGKGKLRFVFYQSAETELLETTIAWQPYRKLSWADFRGNVPGQAPPEMAAVTSCGIAYETNVCRTGHQVKISVYSQFNKEASWVKPGVATAAILVHEQGHFDLCELYCRKLRQAFASAEVTPENMNRVLPRIFKQIEAEYLQRQQNYEAETMHGTIAFAQQLWVQEMSNELNDSLLFAGL